MQEMHFVLPTAVVFNTALITVVLMPKGQRVRCVTSLSLKVDLAFSYFLGAV